MSATEQALTQREEPTQQQSLAPIPPRLLELVGPDMPEPIVRAAMETEFAGMPIQQVARILHKCATSGLNPLQQHVIQFRPKKQGDPWPKPFVTAEGRLHLAMKHPNYDGPVFSRPYIIEADDPLSETGHQEVWIEVTIHKQKGIPVGPVIGSCPTHIHPRNGTPFKNENALKTARTRAVRNALRYAFGDAVPDPQRVYDDADQLPWRDDQRRELHAIAKRQGWDRDERHHQASVILHRDVDTWATLTEADAALLQIAWQHLKDPEDIIDIETPGAAAGGSTAPSPEDASTVTTDDAPADQPSSAHSPPHPDGLPAAVPPVVGEVGEGDAAAKGEGAAAQPEPASPRAAKRKAAADRPSPARKAAKLAEQMAADAPPVEVPRGITDAQVEIITALAQRAGWDEKTLLHRLGGTPVQDLSFEFARDFIEATVQNLDRYIRENRIPRILSSAAARGIDADQLAEMGIEVERAVHMSLPELQSWIDAVEALPLLPREEQPHEPGVIERHLNQVKHDSPYGDPSRPIGQDGWAGDAEQPTLNESPPDRPIEDVPLPDEQTHGDARGARVFLAEFLEKMHPGKAFVQKVRLHAALEAAGIEPKELNELTADEVIAVAEQLEPSA